MNDVVEYKDPDGKGPVAVQYFGKSCNFSRQKYHAHVIAIGRMGESIADSVDELKQIFRKIGFNSGPAVREWNRNSSGFYRELNYR